MLEESDTIAEVLAKAARSELFSINADSNNILYDRGDLNQKLNQLAVDWQVDLLERDGIDLAAFPIEVQESHFFFNSAYKI